LFIRFIDFFIVSEIKGQNIRLPDYLHSTFYETRR